MSSRILPEFELFVPQSVQEAVGILAQYGDMIAVMAGGTDLLIHLKAEGEKAAFREGQDVIMKQLPTVFHPDYILSMNEIPGLDFVSFSEQEGLRIGAMATLVQVMESTVVKERFPAIWKSAAENGTVQTRNVATLVGNLLRGSPAGDCCCAVLACGGSVVLQGPNGKREVPVDEFWLGYRKTARKSDELALEVKIPVPQRGTVTAFNCLTRVTEDISKLNAAVKLTMDGNRCKEARIAMGCVAPVPLRLKKSESVLVDKELTDDLYQSLKESVGTEIQPIDDVRSSAEYRRDVAGILVKRTIQGACNGH
jgi:carbon-monoxide dehydrogenase medium subunit